jgi:DNA-binding CsgD family transcriptional regulator
MKSVNNTNLSEREFQIMELVSTGKQNKEIAEILDLQPDTIGKNLLHVYPKLGVQNRVEASLKFLEITGRITFS